MGKLARSTTLLIGLSSPSFILVASAFAEDATGPATAAFPPATAPAPAASPVPAPLPAAPSPPAGPPPAASPASSAPAYPAPQQPAYPQDPPPPPGTGDPGSGYGYPGGGYGYPPPPPPQNPDDGFKVPDMSIRIDPFNFLLEGRLGLELETQVYKFLSVEVVPVFVTTHSPPTLNYSDYQNSTISQSSNGIGAISGAAVDAGFWFGRKPFNGNVLRVGLSNYSYTYDAKDELGTIDSVSHTDREFFVMFGQHSRWGAFTIAGGIGLGYELNKQNRCFRDDGSAESNCSKDETLIHLDRTGSNVANLDGFLYPFDLLARFSLGVVF